VKRVCPKTVNEIRHRIQRFGETSKKKINRKIKLIRNWTRA